MEKSTYTEACKRYYQSHKAELNNTMKPYKALYRERHREEIRAKAREAYRLKKLRSPGGSENEDAFGT